MRKNFSAGEGDEVIFDLPYSGRLNSRQQQQNPRLDSVPAPHPVDCKFPRPFSLVGCAVVSSHTSAHSSSSGAVSLVKSDPWWWTSLGISAATPKDAAPPASERHASLRSRVVRPNRATREVENVRGSDTALISVFVDLHTSDKPPF